MSKIPSQSNRQASRMGTSIGQSERPTTSNKAAGYNKNLGGKQNTSYKSKLSNLLGAPKELSKEQMIKELERSSNKLLDDSIILKCKGDYYAAKDKCLHALEKVIDFKRRVDSQYFNSELEFGIKLNLGLIYQCLNNVDEAKSIYADILKNEGNFIPGIQVSRVRINIGNIYYKEGKYKEAIKEYQKAYDKVSKENRELRANIAKNIGLCNIKQNSFSSASNYYSEANSQYPDIKTTTNKLLCQLTSSKVNNESILKDFNQMLEVYSALEKQVNETNSGGYSVIQSENINSSNNLNSSTFKEEANYNDELKEYLTAHKKEHANLITTIGLILTNYLDKNDPMQAYEAIIDAFKKNGIKDIVNEFEMTKAMYFLKKRDIEKTITIMKSFENKEKKLISRVSNCVSFLYFIEGNIQQADHYANVALENERYNHKALVNKGNIYFHKQEYSRAKDCYLEAIGVQSDCIEAIYNLGMYHEVMNSYIEAIQAFTKLNDNVPNIPEVLYKLGKMHEKNKDFDESLKYYNILLAQLTRKSKTEQDPFLLSKIGYLYYIINNKDERNYFYYFEESYKYFPGNYDNLVLLGFLNFKDEIYEKAIKYFELASKVNPNCIRTKIQYAQCYQKLGNIKEAYKVYRKIYQINPKNKENLNYLISVCRDLNIPYDEYVMKIREIDDEFFKSGNPNVVYGEPVEEYSNNNYNYSNMYNGNNSNNSVGYGMPQSNYNPSYQGENVNFSEYKKPNINSSKNSIPNYMKFKTSAEELLP